VIFEASDKLLDAYRKVLRVMQGWNLRLLNQRSKEGILAMHIR